MKDMKFNVTTRGKALKINLSADIYGTIAEIGAGQDVANHFFQAGASSGTIAKTMSAYDMTFSDEIYGKTSRYVSEDRLNMMCKKEFALLQERLEERAEVTKFFSFANTMEVLNFQKTNQGHGWMGLKFQLDFQAPPNECIIHMRMYDNDTVLQQKAVGIIGVNLLYACFYHYTNIDLFLKSFLDNISSGSVEIDYIRLKGPDFEDVDNRLLSLELVANKFSRATMFAANGEVLMPSEALYKKSIFIMRGRFRPVTYVNMDMLESGKKSFFDNKDVNMDNTVILAELTLKDLRRKEEKINIREFLDTADLLCALNINVMISNYPEYYLLVEYLSRLNRNKKIGIVLGIYNLKNIFDESYYKNLPGGILESFGRLFGRNVKLYVYPSLNRDSNKGNEIYSCKNFTLDKKLKSLYDYLFFNDKIHHMETLDPSKLSIISDNVLEMIQKGTPGWEEYVPPVVSQLIKENYLFGLPMQAKFR